MHFLQSLVTALPILAPLVSAQIAGVCEPIVSESNPLATKYTKQSTGTLNGTVIITPISFKMARSIIPKQYKILKAQYQQWLPDLPTNQYPAMIQMNLHYDLYNKGASQGSNASYQTAAISFPFVDRINDGYTAFTYTTQIIISEAATSAQSALSSLGYTVNPGYFAACNAYEYENGTANLALPPAKRGIDQAGWAETNTDLGNPDIAYRLKAVSSSPYSTNFYYNITNQPTFSDNKASCDNFVRMYNTDVTESPYLPVHMYGNASALKPYLSPNKGKTIWTDVYGLKVDIAYHDAGNVPCKSLKGFHVINAPSS